MSYEFRPFEDDRSKLMVGFTAFLLFLAGVTSANAREMASAPRRLGINLSAPFGGRNIKAENKVIAIWRIRSANRTENQLEIFDLAGTRLLAVPVLNAVPEARELAIWDVSVGKDGQVAIAAVIRDLEDRRTAALLLYSNQGELLRRVRLEEGAGIRHLEFDADGNIWTLGMGAGSKDPGLLPMVFKYSKDGNELGRYVPRSEFPDDARTIQEGRTIGDSAFGISADRIWFWLPKSRKLATMRRDGSGFEVLSPTLPVPPGSVRTRDATQTVFGKTSLLRSDLLVAEFHFVTKTLHRVGIYQWQKATGEWAPILQGSTTSEERKVLIGIDNNQAVFMYPKPQALRAELEWVPLPTP
jgi:hypothetical protein